MRDKTRIKPFLLELEKLWEKNPDYRFGQIIYLLAEELNCDIFFTEEDQWLEAIKATGVPDYSHYSIRG